MSAAEDGSSGSVSRFVCRQPGGRQRRQHSQCGALGQRPGIDEEFPNAQNVIQVIDGAGDQVHQPGTQPQSQQYAEQSTCQAEQQCLAQNTGEQFPASHADRSQGSQQGPALHHRKRYRVVDQEHANHQSQQAHRRQIQGKGGAEIPRGQTASLGIFQP